ncbi:HipA domain-containing protein [Hansschlegelia quercus]|uniref:HipA domain-containing protein n=1 Tax=Hansschlegelia quercus TaxID=2528245 RepID=UPI001FE120BC|nr:HipA domain-containing protein [Hansschlegelia quercus]
MIVPAPRKSSLNVFINARKVGVLRREASGALSFKYAEGWLDLDAAPPVSLSLPLREERFVGAAVHNVFDNLLPDDDRTRLRLAERVGADGIDAFSLLYEVGRDCAGAMQILPRGTAPGVAGQIEGDALDKEGMVEILRNLQITPFGVNTDEAFRLTLPGVQDRTALLRHEGAWLTPHVGTATTHVLKPRIRRGPTGVDLSDSVENEYLCLKLLESFGVPAARAEIADFGHVRALVVERFDRRLTRDGRLLRLPQEDFCQALSYPPELKRQSDGGPGIHEIVELLKGSDSPEVDIATFLRAQVAFWLIGATEGHAKNFSLLVRSGGRFRLAPVYGVRTAQHLVDARQIEWKGFRLAMAVGRNPHDAVGEIGPRHFVETADASGVGRSVMTAIFEDLAANAAAAAEDVIGALPSGFPDRLTTSLLAAIGRRARLLA